MTKILKIGVAGAGVFGRNHANKIKGDNRAQLIGIYDLDLNRAKTLADELGTQTFSDFDEFMGKIDALVVATPASSHGGVARAALNAKKHCLVEKPLAANSEKAELLCALAKENGLILQAGHQERYIFKAMGLFEIDEKPRKLIATRIGLPSLRGADVSASFDLMVHDLDLAFLLFRSKVVKIDATCLEGPKDKPDAIHAELEFENGGKGIFTASRAANERERKMIIEYEKGKIEIDFLTRGFENTTPYKINADFAERIKDPMQQATSDFISAVFGEIKVAISAEDGARAVKLAEDIDKIASQKT